MDKFVSYLQGIFMNLAWILWDIVCIVFGLIFDAYLIVKQVAQFLLATICCEHFMLVLDRLEDKCMKVLAMFLGKMLGVTTEEYDQFDIGEKQETETEEK